MKGWLYLFPISSKVPLSRAQGEERLYEVVPETERRRIGLSSDTPSHLILDDYNRIRPDELYDFDSLAPVGSFSPRFLAKVARRFLAAAHERRQIGGLTRR